MARLFLLLSFFFNQVINAQSVNGWGDAERALVNKRNSTLSLTMLSKLCSAIREQVVKGVSDPGLRQEEVAFPLRTRAFGINHPVGSHPDSLTGKITWANARNSQTVVIIPGIFQDTEHFFPRFFAQRLSARGYHVIVLPSPFSKPYLGKIPLASVGSFEREAAVYLEAIRSFKQTNPETGAVHVLGLSYGAFIAAVMAAEDKQNLVSGVTLLGPTFRMATTQRLIDEMIEGGGWLSPCAYAAGSQTLPDIQHYTVALVEQFVFFNNEKNRSLRQYSPYAEAEFKKVLALSKREKTAWQDGLRFQNTLRRYTSENLPYYQCGQDTIAYWLSKADARGFKNYRLLTTQDDFLNDPKELEDQRILPLALRNSPHFLLLKEGSHISYLTWSVEYGDWFEQFVKAAF